jgi:hypothetical protein
MTTKRRAEMTMNECLIADAKRTMKQKTDNDRAKANRSGNTRMVTRNIDTVNKNVFKEPS